MVDAIVIAICILIVLGTIFNFARKKRKGISGCSGCGGCSGRDSKD